MIKNVLFDLDDTILDFKKAEKHALQKTLLHYGIEASEETVALYSRINTAQWKLLEKGELDRTTLKIRRFALLFEALGLNFDAKTRRGSNTQEDIFLAYIAGMDAFALGLRMADKLIQDGRIDQFLAQRYSSYTQGIGKRIVDGSITMAELEQYALEMGDITTNISGKQEYLEQVLNEILFGC